MKIKRGIAGGLAVACTALAVTVTGASPADATTRYGCGYPRVCFYQGKAHWQKKTPSAAYKDFTRHYQRLGPKSYGAVAVYNSRNNDGALLHFSNGASWCLKPNRLVFPGPLRVDAIRIMNSPTC